MMGCAITAPSGGSLGRRPVPSAPHSPVLPLLPLGSTAFKVSDLSLLLLLSGRGMILFFSVERMSSSEVEDSMWYLLSGPYLSRLGDLDLSRVEDLNDLVVGRLRDDDAVAVVLSRHGGIFRFTTDSAPDWRR